MAAQRIQTFGILISFTDSTKKMRLPPILFFFSLLLISCGQNYVIENDAVYLKGANEGVGFYKRLLDSADSKTFKVIETDYGITLGKDKKHVFIENNILKNADPNTFKYLGNDFFLDKHSAWFFGFTNKQTDDKYQVLGINSDSLQLFQMYPWAYDNQYLIWGANTLKLDDPKSFTPLNENYGKTKDKVIYTTKIVEGADVQTFEVINNDRAKDKYYRYEYGEIVK